MRSSTPHGKCLFYSAGFDTKNIASRVGSVRKPPSYDESLEKSLLGTKIDGFI